MIRGIPGKDLNLWKIQKNGRTLELPMKSTPPAYHLAYKKRVYSPNRIKYPLKRVDWDPKGERNPQNRGRSKYRRISWDEATDIIASEIRRVQAKYGPNAVLCHGDGHGETKTIHGPHGCQMLLMDKAGGYTLAVRNADSWEGWSWGAEHMWGTMAIGLMENDNLLKDVTDNTEMLVHIGCDLETTPWGFTTQVASRVLYYWTEIGKKQVFVSPDLNYSAAIHADKWIPVLPNTDAALLLAIAYTWIAEGTYDKGYIATHVVGFDKFKDYVEGKEDGVPKTPEWASPKCAFPSGPSKPWPGSGPPKQLRPCTSTEAAISGGRTRTSRPGLRSVCWACRAWVSRVSTSMRPWGEPWTCPDPRVR